ncbi:uncharacterized protein [Typha latifolia]|uniref:uncharacterized protein n=1 Tax=Typha latifolia TaxID=4733 RepID=UPI003C2C38F8
MFCGTGSFKHVDDDPCTASASPRRTKKKKPDKNPYSSRGLDKYSTVLSELNSRREKILAKAGSDGIAMVRFMFSSSHDWVPVIVKLRDPKTHDQEDVKNLDKRNKNTKALSSPTKPEEEADKEAKEVAKEAKPTSEIKEVAWSWRRWTFGYHWPLVMILILVCLVLFGRVFAICCTSIWWYSVPVMKDWDGNMRKSTRKKEYRNRLSAKKMGGVLESSSPKAHVNGKKGK